MGVVVFVAVVVVVGLRVGAESVSAAGQVRVTVNEKKRSKVRSPKELKETRSP